MKAKEFIPASKPRNPVVRQQQTSGAGAHRDKKKEQKQGYEKHKGKVEEYGDTAKGQKMLTKVQKRAVDRMIKADDKRDAKAAKKNQQTANRAWDRMDTSEGTNMDEAGYFGGGTSFSPGWSGRRNRADDWDEGNTEPPNNFAIYINGKKWKVFQGRGTYADDFKEKQHYRQLQDWAQKKSDATGKKWTVHITGEAPTA
jgi:hypothetical protein